MANDHPLLGVKALTFDVFGTVVDWRGSIAREIKSVGMSKVLSKIGTPLPTNGGRDMVPR